MACSWPANRDVCLLFLRVVRILLSFTIKGFFAQILAVALLWKNLLMLLAVRISSYGCTWEVWKALKKLELLSAAPRATLTHFPCSPNLPHASITRYTHAKHKHIRKLCKQDSPLLTREVVSIDPLTSRSDWEVTSPYNILTLSSK